MSGLLVTASVAPLLATPSLRSEQASQLVLGEGAEILETRGDMLRVRTLLDRYEGWIATGYVALLPLGEVETWLASAGWSAGALLGTTSGQAVRAPHRARLELGDGVAVRLPTGDVAAVLTGNVLPYDALVRDARTESPAAWAWREFAGTPYLWGGITGAGIDCSGLVQNAFLARGVTLPRDAHQQAAHGEVLDLAASAPGDLLFFRGRDSERVSHVGIIGDDGDMVHSTVDTGGVVRESLAAGSRAHALMPRLVAVRRIA
ncbi:MAG TPA: C40 family peptidase [Gemmatimonadales bacterium]